jgi:hypothetical protein
VTISPRRMDQLSSAALALSWLGIWGAWIAHPDAGLTLDAVDLAEWAGFLTDVRSGPLGAMPSLLRLGIALMAVALAVSAAGLTRQWLRWPTRIVAAVPGLMLLPPYPYFLQPWRSPEYGIRFVVAMVLWLGVLAACWAGRLRPAIRRLVVVALSVGAAGAGLVAYLALRRPFQAHYAAHLPPGWGVIIFAGGLAIAAGCQLAAWIAARRLSG